MTMLQRFPAKVGRPPNVKLDARLKHSGMTCESTKLFLDKSLTMAQIPELNTISRSLRAFFVCLNLLPKDRHA
jgi:hypothetical protein